MGIVIPLNHAIETTELEWRNIGDILHLKEPFHALVCGDPYLGSDRSHLQPIDYDFDHTQCNRFLGIQKSSCLPQIVRDQNIEQCQKNERSKQDQNDATGVEGGVALRADSIRLPPATLTSRT